MKNKEILSAVIGSGFFAIPYLGLSVALVPSLLMGCAAFGATELIFANKNNSTNLKIVNYDLYQKIVIAKKQNKEILSFIPKIEKEEIKICLNEIHTTVEKIINVVEKNPKKAEKIDNFFDYYLPVLIKILKRYDEIENHNLVSKDGKSFILEAGKMIVDTKDAFKSVLSSLYQKDLIDAASELKVYELMLKADGIVSDNLIMKGSVKNEK